jgi:iron complex transport system substrate-binding protein
MIASATEIICALGCEENLVGCSHECDYPPSVRKLPITTETKFQADGTSYQIDERIKAILQEGLSVYRVKADLLKKLNPDLIVTQTQCEVCAVSAKDVESATCQWLGIKPEIVSLHPNSMSDLWIDIQRVAAALHVEDKGETLIAQLKDRIEKVRDQAQKLIQKVEPPRIACIEWIDPLMAAGNWVPELVEIAGGRNLFGEAGKHSPWMTWEQLQASDPDLISLMPCGFDIPRTRSEMNILAKNPIWNSLRAVRENQIYIMDGNQYFNRPGPRLVDSLEIMLEILHLDRIRPRYQGRGWVKL